ncbi:hypothetical protein CLV94_3023 [Flavobacterium endophyticum]|uniref:Uncharacterized protein n=1 Tax=Flavobacterium endophyticum TaxID=1540163 RepID=A0A495M174_9FLAO|nr:hypothetical protein CLV94_3023 [Flavobacterium endophyticum]
MPLLGLLKYPVKYSKQSSLETARFVIYLINYKEKTSLSLHEKASDYFIIPTINSNIQSKESFCWT